MSEKSKKKTKKKIRSIDSEAEAMIDLRFKELAQRERLENRKLDLEEKKWEHQKANEGKITQDVEKFNTYRKMFGSGDSATANEYTLKKLEMEQTERLEDRETDKRIIEAKCPNCLCLFPIILGLPKMICPYCRKVYDAGY